MEDEDAHVLRRWISVGDILVLLFSALGLAVSYGKLSADLESVTREVRDLQTRDITPGARSALSAIAARNSADMIGKLNRALTVEIIFVAAFIGIAFRSFAVMLVGILPGIFPVVLAGTVLWTMGEGLQFASVVALTVSFGLGLSATS